jgi:nitrite reductase/ring-hydroxylating ferredoxin subunit
VSLMRPTVPGAEPDADAPDHCAEWQWICASDSLVDGGDGVRFDLPAATAGDPPRPAFVIRSDGMARAWLNRCAHVPIELDWMPGKFFDSEGLYLTCATHGAIYEPATGRCVGGPCRGKGLEAVPVREQRGAVWVDISTGKRGER